MTVYQTNTLDRTTEKDAGSLIQLWHFVLHLRWHYQLFILSGGFLIGGLLNPGFNAGTFVFQFFNVHLLLFGGATAYNSYWDNDNGPVGGLRNPPPVKHWMWLGAMLLQMIGFLLAVVQGSLYTGIYALSMLLFWLYSTPWARWKGRPVKSLIAIGISTGFNSVLLGYMAAGYARINIIILIAALGVMLMLLSLYPTSQIYQKDEDLRRGDQTFTLQYGKKVVLLFFDASFFTGLVMVAMAIFYFHKWIAVIFGLLGLVTGLIVRLKLRRLTASEEDYFLVMQIKYGTSMAFTLFLLIALVFKHT